MQLSPRELRSIAADVDDMHRDSMRTFTEEVTDLHLDPATRPGRRAFLTKAAVGGATVGFGASLLPIGSLLPAAAQEAPSDVDIAVFAESVELAAVEAYKAGAPLLSAEVLPVAELFLSHHQEHAGAFGSLAGDSATGAPNAALLTALGPTIEGLETEADVLGFAQAVENQAVATYAFALTVLSLEAAYAGTATILPVESAHAVALGLALGQPVADQFGGAFESASIADGINPSDFPVA